MCWRKLEIRLFIDWRHNPRQLQELLLRSRLQEQVGSAADPKREGEPRGARAVDYRLEFSQGLSRNKGVNLILFDAAVRISEMRTQWLCTTSTLLIQPDLFFDRPLQLLQFANDSVRIARALNPSKIRSLASLSFSRARASLDGGMRIGAPTAFVLSKSDLLSNIVNKRATFLNDGGHAGRYDLTISKW